MHCPWCPGAPRLLDTQHPTAPGQVEASGAVGQEAGQVSWAEGAATQPCQGALVMDLGEESQAAGGWGSLCGRLGQTAVEAVEGSPQC